MDFYTLIGLAGAASYVVSYGLLQFGLLDGNGVRYSVANVVAAVMMLVSLTDQFNLAATLIQITWIAIGVTGLALRALPRRAAPALVATSVPAHAHIAEGLPSASYDLRPDKPRIPGQPTLGLRADVVGSAS